MSLWTGWSLHNVHCKVSVVLNLVFDALAIYNMLVILPIMTLMRGVFQRLIIGIFSLATAKVSWPFGLFIESFKMTQSKQTLIDIKQQDYEKKITSYMVVHSATSKTNYKTLVLV